MIIVVCIKQVPDTTEVEIDPVTGVLKRSGIDSKMNPYDLYAIETALRIKEQTGGTVKVITMGPPQAAEVIREAYQLGVDEGILLTDRRFAGADVLATSHTLSQGIQKSGCYDLILCGKQTTDGDTAQVGPEIAEYLGIPHITNVMKIMELKEKSIQVEIDMAHTVEIQKIMFPCLITVEKGIYEPRLPSYKKKIMTKDKKIATLTLDDFDDRDESGYGLNGSPTQVERIFPPDTNDSREIWTGTGSELGTKIAEKLIQLKFV